MMLNLNMEPGFVVDELGFEYRSEEGLAGNMEVIVSEFRKSRGLTPIRILVHGPPAVGKTRLAKRLCDRYELHYLDVKSAIAETVNDLVRKKMITVKT